MTWTFKRELTKWLEERSFYWEREFVRDQPTWQSILYTGWLKRTYSPRNLFTIADIVIRLITMYLSDWGYFCFIILKFNPEGWVGGSLLKSRNNSYCVVHHCEGLGRTGKIICQIIFFHHAHQTSLKSKWLINNIP